MKRSDNHTYFLRCISSRRAALAAHSDSDTTFRKRRGWRREGGGWGQGRSRTVRLHPLLTPAMLAAAAECGPPRASAAQGRPLTLHFHFLHEPPAPARTSLPRLPLGQRKAAAWKMCQLCEACAAARCEADAPEGEGAAHCRSRAPGARRRPRGACE